MQSYTVRILAAILFLLLAPALGRAEPVAVTLYPDGAEITEAATLPLSAGDGRPVAVITLPARADAASLRLTAERASGLTPADVSVKSVLRTDEGRIKEVQKLLDAAKAERQDLADKRAAHAGAADYWRSLAAGESPAKAAEAQAMARAVRDGLAAELAAASKLDREIKDADTRVRELEKELQGLTGGGRRVLEATISFTGPGAKSVACRWTYRAAGAGWTPEYSLNALPGEERVDFAWGARIRQETGAPWKDVALTLATARFAGGTEPPALPHWNLRPQEELLRRAAKLMTDMAVQTESLGAAPAAEADPARTQGRMFDAYDAGRATLDSGQSRRLHLGAASWKAEFDYLVRPWLGPGAYTRAAVNLDETPRYPAGQASYLLDSALVRTGSFSLFDKKADLFFGMDPQVAVRLTPLTRQSGEAGFLGSKKSRAWDWRVTVQNHKSLAVSVRMEDRVPGAGDERIKIEKRLPGAEEEEGRLAVWTFKVPAGGQHVVEYGYTATYPKEINLDLGGR
ncbi:DUF4139 domain-containing protein [Desulfocurvus sp. DL9XJH121]